jgi:hypothetical protein
VARHVRAGAGEWETGAPGAGALVGSVNWITAPQGAPGAAHKRPPWFSTIERQIDNPIPSPLSFVE